MSSLSHLISYISTIFNLFKLKSLLNLSNIQDSVLHAPEKNRDEQNIVYLQKGLKGNIKYM